MKNYENNEIKHTCPICGKAFISNHHRRKYCSRECAKTAHLNHTKQWQKDHRERFLKNKKIYYKKHKKEYEKSRKKYYQKHKEEAKSYGRKYYREHRNKRREYSRNYYREHKYLMSKCKAKYNNCFNCPTKDGECLFD